MQQGVVRDAITYDALISACETDKQPEPALDRVKVTESESESESESRIRVRVRVGVTK